MREILYRGKCISNGEWVYGDLIHTLGGHPLICTKHVFGAPAEVFEVDYATVGQYIGVKDKNGNKIFEGDLVSYIIVTGGIEDLSIPANVRHTVTYDEKHGAFRIGYHYFCGGTMREVVDANNLVVIGNIYDMKGGEE
jgi:uncharacterized phage protein (TIGR01671 family)